MKKIDLMAMIIEFMVIYLLSVVLFMLLIGAVWQTAAVSAVTAFAGTILCEIASRKMFAYCIRKEHELAEKEDKEDAAE